MNDSLRSRLHDALITARSAAAPLLGEVAAIHARAMTVPGWINGEDAREMVRTALALPPDAVAVEVGVFMGRSAALISGAFKRRGNGVLVAIDPFDCSGEDYSAPSYAAELRASGQPTLEQAFRGHMRRLGLLDRIEVRPGFSSDLAATWDRPIDLLLLDADHSLDGARAAYDEWIGHLKPGGILILANTADRPHPPGHDGYRALVEELVWSVQKTTAQRGRRSQMPCSAARPRGAKSGPRVRNITDMAASVDSSHCPRPWVSASISARRKPPRSYIVSAYSAGRCPIARPRINRCTPSASTMLAMIRRRSGQGDGGSDSGVCDDGCVL